MADVRWIVLASLLRLLIWTTPCCGQDAPSNPAYAVDPNLYAIEDHLVFPERPSDYYSFRKSLMYPYDRLDLTNIDSSKQEHEVSLQARLPFFGFYYKYIKVHLNGYLHFGGAPSGYSFPIRFPLRPEDTIREKDPALIAPWLSFQSMVSDIPESGVYFRLFRIGEPSYRDPDGWLEKRAIEDFREGMIGAADFKPIFVVIATWRNVTLTGMQNRNNIKTNTYQVVLASNERRTYVMFNYEKIDWIAVNDVNNGENGENPFVGFNAGNTTRYYEFLPYSQEPRVKNLPQHGEGNGIKGRYIFQIDEEIWHGSCIKWELVPGRTTSRPRLTFFPKYASMLGGAIINVTGPCFEPNEKIECQFQDMSGHKLPAIYRDTNHASCLMPPVMFHGYVDLTVSQGSKDAMFSGRFYVQPPELAAEDIEILDDNDKAERPENIRIKWHPHKLINNNNTNVQLHLWGYNDDLEYPQLTYIDSLSGSMRNGDMRYTINVEQFRERYNWDKLNYQFGFLSINLTDPSVIAKDYKNSPTIWSRPMPLAWYFSHQWERRYGSGWKDKFCDDWFQREKNSDRFALTLWRCPCTMKQSDFDRGRFAPDSNCNTYSKKCEPLHKGAQHCVRTGRPSVGGSGQTCCYDMEGELMLTADTMYGGRPSRIFSYGILPFNSRVKVPTLSWWNVDAVPFFYCCHWQYGKDDSESCQKYKYWRTSQDCSAYQPPGYAAVFGDPHFLTFDGANYTFSARGEFVLVRVDDPKGKLEIQGRFESPKRTQLDDTIVNGTYLSAVAVRDNTSSTVEIHLRPSAARWNYQLYLIVDSEFIYFWDETMRIQNFKGVTIYQPTGYYNMSKIVAMFDSGAGVEVLVNNEQLTLNVFLPIEFINITRGLLGFWDRRVENDLMPPVGNSYTPTTASFEQIYNQFGNLWRLNESSALFNHDAIGYKFGHYDDQSFKPYLEDPPRIPQNFTYRPQDVADTCSSSKACIFDFIVTGNKHYAATTKANEAAVQSTRKEVSEEVIRCPALDKPANGRKSEIRNFVGRTVRFSCNDGYRLVGHEVRQCKEYGLWSWGIDVTCISNASYARKIVGITLGILLPISIIFCLVFFCFFKRNRHKKSHYTGSNGDFSKFKERKATTYHAPEKVSETAA
ncbi:protein mesh isoform X1 [Ixodes scapularis]|uniref:protein mesh isoform X1 n=1 Tax=Ixodes scapularis TaxID=6945 RepID=UPI001A9E3A0D|nr:protein mesh isoform X1 [Ixodes scapularis]XP_040066721.1 protein mesh isoform X1 [Ixodes scapularis]XP_040356998.1 protein mesh isoform X1 [Ixodes scapularis]